MSYQNGSATGPTDLLQQLATWLVSLGWTQDRNASEASGWTFSGHKSGNYVHLRAAVNEHPWQRSWGVNAYALHMYMGTGYNGSNTWNAQTTGAPVGAISNPVGVGMALNSGPFSNYYFFADSSGEHIVVVVEKTPGNYVHLGWGPSILKAGAITGGQYFFGSTSGYYTEYNAFGSNTPGFNISTDCPFSHHDQIGGCCAFVRADVDSFTGKWVSVYLGGSNADQGYQGKNANSSVFYKSYSDGLNYPAYGRNASDFAFQLVSQMDMRANLIPLLTWVYRDGTTTGVSLLGAPPFLFQTFAVGNGFSNAQEISIGGTTYKLFPSFAVVKQ